MNTKAINKLMMIMNSPNMLIRFAPLTMLCTENRDMIFKPFTTHIRNEGL